MNALVLLFIATFSFEKYDKKAF